MLRRDFHFGGHALRVEGDAEPLLWLQEFVEPQFATWDTDKPDETIRFIVDARMHARLAAHGPHPGDLTRACFTLDSGIVSGRVWHAPDAAEVVFEEARDVFYRRGPFEPRVVEVVAARDGAAARVALMRVVREYAMLYASRADWLMVHAAAVCIGDDAFVIAGPKQAGKTTLLLHALRNEQGTYVSNDRVALHAEPSGVMVYGIPTIVSIRAESTDWFPDLDPKLSGVQYDARSTVAKRDVQPESAPPTPPRRWSLSPPQLCDIFGVQSRAAARVAGLLFPRVEGRPGGATLEQLDSEQALDAFRGALFRSCPTNGMFRIGEAPESASDGAMAAHAMRVLARVPSFLCRLGSDAYRDGVPWLSTLGRRCAAPRAAL
jgi:hypothetical protein